MFGQHDHHDEEDKRDEGHPVPATDNSQGSDNSSDDTWQHPGVPLNDTGDDNDDNNGPSDTPVSDDSGDSHDEPSDFSQPQQDQNDDTHASSDDGLADLKLEALSKLSPLVNHLDQSPEEKFRTLMMMIQASDDQSLIRQAYETSLSIGDEKERAQALLDIVNEINYFTQHSN